MATLNRTNFLQLHDSLFKRFEAECAANSMIIPETVRRRYGFEKQDEPSLRASIEQCCIKKGMFVPKSSRPVEVKNCLYTNLTNLNADPGLDNVVIPDHQYKYFLIYLDEEAKVTIKGPQVDTASSRAVDVKPKVIEAADSYTRYDGYFYSYVSNKVMSAKVEIDYTQTPFKVRMEGFHQQPGASIYTGTAQRKSDYLFINLEGWREGWSELDEFKMIGHINYVGKLENQGWLCCLFLGVSSYNYPAGGEMVLLNPTLAHHDSPKIIKRYLILKHNRIRVKANPGDDLLASLRVKGNPVNFIEQMIGVYRVLNFNSQGNLVISKFIINEDYTSSFEVATFGPSENIQVCLMEISSVVRRRLCITTYPKIGANIIAYVMVNIFRNQSAELTEGTFSSVGGNGATNPFAGPIVLQRVQSDSFKPEVIELPRDFTSNASISPDITQAFNRLVMIHRRYKKPY